MAGVHGRHTLAEPVPWVGSGCGRGWRKLAWGKQKLSEQVKIPAASSGAFRAGGHYADIARSASTCPSKEAICSVGGICPLCWGNLSPKPPNKDAIPPHRKQWGILA